MGRRGGFGTPRFSTNVHGVLLAAARHVPDVQSVREGGLESLNKDHLHS